MSKKQANTKVKASTCFGVNCSGSPERQTEDNCTHKDECYIYQKYSKKQKGGIKINEKEKKNNFSY